MGQRWGENCQLFEWKTCVYNSEYDCICLLSDWSYLCKNKDISHNSITFSKEKKNSIENSAVDKYLKIYKIN